ncbi:MAG: ATP-dependent Clp protease ATP-binding subunit, partial [Elusimicrobia bacterium]|nr:ATP-dependent Clp protease ATP-binding subunit [Elusimicrobiota bacterium]
MKLSPGAELAWRLAAEEAHALLQTRIDREHLALGLLGLERAVLLQGDREGLRPAVRRAVLAEHDAVKAALEACGLKVQGFADALRAALPRGARAGTAKVISRTPEAKAAFARAGALAAAPDAAALLAALLQDPGEPLAGALACAGTDAGTLARSLERGRPGEAPPRRARPPEPAARGSALERYGRDLTRLAREGKLGPVLGRRPVLLQVLQTLSRATKNNVVLVGEAGVGKTAVVEALALRAAEGKDPKVLGGKRIVELQLGALLAGTKMRGEFEERLQR